MQLSSLPETALSARVRTASWAAHGDAEGSGFMAQLMAGELPAESFAQLVAQQWFLYDAIETAAVGVADPVLDRVAIPEVARAAALAADAAHWFGPDWRDVVSPLPETVQYCDRVRTVAGTWPPGLVAHHYVRSMGDLSGGPMIGRAAAKAYGLVGEGVAFYRFADLDDGPAYKARYRELLDEAPWSSEDQDRFIDEVLVAYALSTAMLDALA